MNTGDWLAPRLSTLYEVIDTTYTDAAEKIGFTCNGCDGVTCCTVDLILHTSVEIMYLRLGLNSLAPELRERVIDSARAILAVKYRSPYGDAYRNAVCAGNIDGLCVLYKFRPMICRLAGIPHVIHRPDGREVRSEGCARYNSDFRSLSTDLEIDRTGFYREMAQIEIEIIKTVGRRIEGRTVAEVLGFTDDELDLSCYAEHGFLRAP